MGLFDFRKKGKVIDLTERYRKQQERTENIRKDMQQKSSDPQTQESSGGMFSIFEGATPSIESESTLESSKSPSTDLEEKRRRLSKRLLDMTSKIEELSNQIYHLQQRIEVLERKAGVGGF